MVRKGLQQGKNAKNEDDVVFHSNLPNEPVLPALFSHPNVFQSSLEEESRQERLGNEAEGVLGASCALEAGRWEEHRTSGQTPARGQGRDNSQNSEKPKCLRQAAPSLLCLELGQVLLFC